MKNARRNYEKWEKTFIYLAAPLFKTKDIAEVLGRTTATIQTYCSKNKLFKKKVRVGDRFGKLVVKRKLEKEGRDVRWRCECDCGSFMTATTNTLMSGHSETCGCGRIEAISSGYGVISGTWFASVKKNAQARNIKVEVSLEYLDALFKKQEGKCALSGLPIIIKPGRKTRETTASLDRIDNNLDYVEGNVQFLHKHINYMKWAHTQDYFIKLCNAVTENNKG